MNAGQTGPAQTTANPRPTKTWWTFRIFFIFSVRERGRGSPRRREGGGGRDVLLSKSQEEGVPGRVGARGRGAGRVFAGNCAGGLNFFFRGQNYHQEDIWTLVALNRRF